VQKFIILAIFFLFSKYDAKDLSNLAESNILHIQLNSEFFVKKKLKYFLKSSLKPEIMVKICPKEKNFWQILDTFKIIFRTKKHLPVLQ